MKFPIQFIAILVISSIFSISCTNQDQAITGPDKIENTVQSVSYFKDTVGYDPQQILEYFNQYNNAIAEIGYPDAGYQVWLVQEDTSDVTYMVEGHWPTQSVYDEIHEHQLYQEAANNDADIFDGMVWKEYHRFTKIK